MRRITTILTAMVLGLGLTAGNALAMEPPAEAAKHLFGCVDGQDSAVAGHPGARGLVDATPRVGGLTGNEMPTAWNAVAHAGPIELGGC